MAINFDKVPSYIKREINPPRKVLKSGSSGFQVKQVQEWLQFHQCRTAIDGKFGPATAECVRDFQKTTGLTITGTVNRMTWESLVGPMNAALEQPSRALSGSVDSTIKRVAQQHVRQHPQEIGGSNCGPWVRLYCGGHDGTAWPWCAGFVSMVMSQACFYRGETTPIPGSVSCDSLAAQAKDKGLFVSGASVKSGKFIWTDFGSSCIFLRRRTKTDWTHTGFALGSTGTKKNLVFDTIEGNTNDDGVREGYEACERKRSLSTTHYDFIRLE